MSDTPQARHVSTDERDRLDGIRIARISTVAFFLVTQLKDQVVNLTKMGADVTLICSPGPELRQLSLGRGLRYIPVRIERSIRPLQDLIALIRLFRIFRAERLDIIHTTTPKAGLIAVIAAFFARIPVRMHTFTGQVWVTQHGCMRWLARFSDQVIGALATQCYADSPSQGEFLIAEGIVSSTKLRVIGQGSLSGVDMHRFDPECFDELRRTSLRESLGIAQSAAVFLFIGRMDPDKGVFELLEAFEDIRNEGFDVALVMVGPLNDECGGEASITAQDLRARPDVHYVGFTERPEEYIAIAEALCLPSYREGFGTVVIEAAAMAVPTIGSRIVGLIDAIKDGETGILVEPHSAAALRKAMQRILTEPGLRSRLGAAARARCAEAFDSEKVTRAMAGEYRRSLTQAQGGR